ncbi:hypothetical protein LJR078_001911 [Arthrobacter sp. LjRoot78]|uniref:hypothetical protein n=1 Tax=Arthrobacter sp. LjRoot78 TaxID=3342338 RepID=UPI003ECC9C90
MLATPEAFVLALGGIAMLRARQQAFVTAFATNFTLGALVTFMVTISGLDRSLGQRRGSTSQMRQQPSS